MKHSNLTAAAMALAVAMIAPPAAAQNGRPVLHVNPRWDECAFQLDPSLSREAWRQFTKEAGVVVYFRPLIDAEPMGKGKFEVAMLQWETGIDDNTSAWNDTFVHPHDTHWLFDGSRLPMPGLTVRAGVTDKTDVGVYVTKNPEANYGFYGAQVQRNFFDSQSKDWALAGRVSFVSLFGPDDLDFTVIGWDMVASKEVPLNSWARLSPYASFSSYFGRAHEKSAVVDLKDEYEGGSQMAVGTVLKVSGARLAVEYSRATVNSLSLKLGFGR